MSDALSQAQALLPYIREFRRDIHQHPELSMEEFRTSQRIAAELSALGLEPVMLRPTGVVADIEGSRRGPLVALRADIDALPITEASGVDFASVNPGVMHACGHDMHAAMLLGAARLLVENKEQLQGRVRLIFQPGEESGQGGLAVIEQGWLTGAAAALALHVAPQTPSGAVITRKGPILPAVGRFTIRVEGRSCHGAMPEQGADASLAAAAILLNLQAVVSREISPLTPAVLTVGSIHSGTGYNVVSGEAILEGTVRLFDDVLHQAMPAIMERHLSHIAQSYDCAGTLEYHFDSPALVNDEAATTLALAAAAKLLPPQMIIDDFPGVMGGEDFAVYTPHLPCAYLLLGVGGDYPIHNEHLVLDEEALAVGAALHAQFALDFLSAPV